MMAAGLSMGQVQSVTRETIAYAREKIGDDAVGEIVGAVPGLSQSVCLNRLRKHKHKKAAEEARMSYPITDIEGIDGDVAAILKSVGIRSTDRLLEAARTVRDAKHSPRRPGFEEKQSVVLGQRRRPHAHQGHQQGICRAVASRRRRYRERTQVSKSAQSRQGDGRRQQAPQAGPPVAVRKGGQALDRKRQTAAAENHLLKSPPARQRCLTAPRRPRKATGMGNARTLDKPAGTAHKIGAESLSALYLRWAARW